MSIVWASAADFTPLYVPALDAETLFGNTGNLNATHIENTSPKENVFKGPDILYIPLGVDTPPPGDSLPFKQTDSDIDPFLTDPHNYWILNDPSNVKTEITYDPKTGDYNLEQKIGDDINYRPPTYMTSREYNDQRFDEQMRKYWRERLDADNAAEAQKRGLIPQIKIKNKI